MRQRWLVVVLAAAIVGLLGAGIRYTRQVSASLTGAGPSGDARTPRPTIRFVKNSKPVPEFTVTDLSGRRVSSADWRGKVTIVNFWATWCPPCRAEIPDLIALQTKYPDHLRVIGVSNDEGPVDTVRRFAEEHRINYPIVMATPELKRAFPGVFAIPTTFVIDREGKTVQRHVGLISVSIYELETRALAGLPVDATIETVDDSGHVLLANAAQATEIPGLDLSGLTPAQRTTALQRLNADLCPCGCELTLAQCRINDGACGVSLPLAKQLVEKIQKASE